MCGSDERIYQFIYAGRQLGGGLRRNLRSQKKRRKVESAGGRPAAGSLLSGVSWGSLRPPPRAPRSATETPTAETIIGKRGTKEMPSASSGSICSVSGT